MYFLETLQLRAPCHGGVLYVFFYIDGMLFEFCIIFLNIEKTKNLRFCFQYFMFLRVLCYFQYKKMVLQKHLRGGGWGVDTFCL